MTRNRYRPPRLFQAIVKRMIQAPAREFMLGDLHEEFCEVVDSSGRLRASLWYLRQTVGVVLSQTTRPFDRILVSLRHRRSMRESFTNGFWNDINGAVRTYRNRPGLSAVALGTIALGIGASTAIFSVIDRVTLRPLPYDAPEELYAIWTGRTFTKEMVAEFEEQTTTWETVSGYVGWGFSIVGIDSPTSVNGAQVSGNYFSLVRASAAIGRTLVAGDGLPGAEPAVVLSHHLWETVFGGDSAIVGQTIQMGGADFPTRTVVGVMPADYRDINRQNDAWVPFLMDPTDPDYPRSWYVRLYGRVSSSASPQQLQTELDGFAAAARQKRPAEISEEEVATATIVPLKAFLVGDTESMMILLGGAAGLVLLIACANIANLLLALSATREKEFAIRGAIGAGNGRVFRQILTESAVLGIVGGALGILVAYSSLGAFKARAGSDLPLLEHVSIDIRVILFATGLTIFCSLLFGLLPALKGSGSDLAESLKSDSRTSSKAGLGRLSAGLISAEVALAVLLTVGAGLMLRSFALLNRVDPGFNVSVIAIDITLPPLLVGGPDQQRQFFRDLNERLAGTPGVQQAGTVHLLPLTDSNWNFPTYPQGFEVTGGTPPPNSNFRVIGPGYFQTMQIPIIRGRDITDSDYSNGEQVGLINQTMAELYWPDQDPIGKQITLFSPDGPSFNVVGVVANIKQHSLSTDTRPEMYRPYDQWTIGRSYLVARVAGTPESMIPTLKAAVKFVNANVPTGDIHTLDEILSTSTAESQYIAEITGLFALVALAMGAIGVYGVTSYVVGRRTREIGVRMALGANRGQVLLEVFAQSSKPVVVGLVFGLLAALGVGRLVESLLFEIEATDSAVFLVATMVIIASGAAASIIPARRASRVDPNVALRSE